MSYEIFTAAETNDIKKLKELIAKGVDVNAEDWDRGSTPLMWACAKGNFQAIELLLDAGADVNKQNRQGRTALHNLVSLRYDKIAVWLVKRGADPYIPDKKGFTPMDLALPFVQQELKGPVV
jgi:ankyrin repeat protein